MSKSKAVQACRSINAEQTQKLQSKYHFEQDLFDDIRAFAGKWSSLEKEYSQSLSRLAASFKSKRELPVTPVLEGGDLLSDGANSRAVADVWKLTLDMVEVLASSHMTVSESVTSEIAEPCKAVSKSRPQESKKLFEVLSSIQDDVFQSTREMSKAKKAYFELEHEAGICRKNHTELQDRLGNKSQRRFFESKAQLEKKFQTLESKLEICEKRSTQARNEYLLSIAGCNALNELYFKEELPCIMESLDGTVYEKFSSCLASVGRITSEAAQQALTDFQVVRSEAEKVERKFAVRCFMQSNPVMTGVVRHVYSPYKEDPVSGVTRDHDGEATLTIEARKLTSRIAQCMSLTETKEKEIQAISNLSETYTKNPDLGSNEARQTADDQLHELRNNIRRMRFMQCKAQARLDVLGQCGIDVDDWLQSAIKAEKTRSETGEQRTDALSPRESSASIDSFDNSLQPTFDDDFDEFDESEAGPSSNVLLTAPGDADAVSDYSTYVSNTVRRAVVLYDYTAQTDEELSVLEGNEILILLSSGDGWVKVQTGNGKDGYVPETYIEERSGSVNSSQPGSVSRSSFLSGNEALAETRPTLQEINDDTLTNMMAAAESTQEAVAMVRALYSYEAMESEELTFDAGAVFKLLRKDDGVDDGWWEGEFDGKRGVFPSVVVEELSPDEVRSLSSTATSAGPVPVLPYLDPDQTPIAERGDPFAVELTPVNSTIDTSDNADFV